MNQELELLAKTCALDDDQQRPLRLRFGFACANRVRHLLEDPRAIELLNVLQAYFADSCDENVLAAAAAEAAQLANHHRGSVSIDGTKHAAVSATYAVANALAGRALDAADYAAYSTVYGYGVYAVNDPESFAPEHAWQVSTLRTMIGAMKPLPMAA